MYNFWISRFIMIINKMSIVKQEIFSHIAEPFVKAYSVSTFITRIFGNFYIVIVMETFYWFFSITRYLFGADLRLIKIMVMKSYSYLFLSSYINIRNMSKKQFNFCITLETGTQGGINLDRRHNTQWGCCNKSKTLSFIEQYYHHVAK